MIKARCWLALGLVAALADPAAAVMSCEEVTVEAGDAMEMGLLRGESGTEGFVELHPDRGMTLSNDGASHQGSFGPASAKISGPPDSEVLLFVEVTRVSNHDENRLAVAEILVKGAMEKTRLDHRGESFRILLPERVNQKGVASKEIKLGASYRYADPQAGVQAEYRLAVECIKPDD